MTTTGSSGMGAGLGITGLGGGLGITGLGVGATGFGVGLGVGIGSGSVFGHISSQSSSLGGLIQESRTSFHSQSPLQPDVSDLPATQSPQEAA